MGLLTDGFEALGWKESDEAERRRLLQERLARGQGVLNESQQLNAIPQGGVSPERFMSNEFQPAINTPQGQADAYQGLLGAGYTDPQATRAIGLLNPQAEAEQIGVKDMFSMTQDLSKQRTKLLAPYMEQRAQSQKTLTALQQGTGAGDLAAVISFNKSLDPTSVVRESEAAAVSGVAGPIERLRGLLKDIEGKGKLQPTARRQIASLIGEIQKNETEYANNIVTDFTNRANRYQINPQDIRGGQLGYAQDGTARESFDALTVPQSLSMPAIGAQEDGYQFMGGNPADPSNWSKI